MATRRDVVELRIQAIIDGLSELKKTSSELDKLGAEGVETAAELQRLNQEFANLRDIEKNIQDISELAAEQKKLGNALRDATSVLKLQQAAFASQRSAVEGIEQSITEVREQSELLAKSQKTIAAATKAAGAELNKQNTSLAKNARAQENLSKEIRDTEGSIQKAQASIEKYNNTLQERGKLTQQDANRLDAATAKLQTNTEKLNQQTAALRKLKEQQEQISSSQAQAAVSYERQEKSLDEINASYKEAISSQKQYEAELKNQAKALSSYEKEIRDTEKAIDSLRAEQEKNRDTFKELSTELRSSGISLRNFQSAAKASVSNLSTLESEVRQFENSLRDLKTSAQAPLETLDQGLKITRAEFERTSSTLKSFGADTEKVVADLGQTADRLTSSFRETGNEIDKLFREISSTTGLIKVLDDFEKLQSELKQVDQQVNESEAAFEKLAAAFKQLQKPTRDNVNEFQRARNELSLYRAQQSQLLGALQQASTVLRSAGVDTSRLADAQREARTSLDGLVSGIRDLNAASTNVGENLVPKFIRMGDQVEALRKGFSELRSEFRVSAKEFENVGKSLDKSDEILKAAQSLDKFASELEKAKNDLKATEKAQEDLNRALASGSISTDKALQAQRRLNSQYDESKRAIDSLEANVEGARNALNRLGLAFEETATSAQISAAAVDLAASSINRVEDAANRFAGAGNIQRGLGNLNASFRRWNREIQDGLRGLRSMEGALATLGAGVGIREIAQTVVEFESLKFALDSIRDTSQQAESDFRFLRTEANRLGVNLLALSQSYVGFIAATKDAGVSTANLRDVFSSVSEALSRLGRSSDDIKGALKAIEQAFSKQILQAEELRGQLGERLPGAVGLAADALNVTTAELLKLQAEGRVLAKDVFAEFPRVLKEAGLTANEEVDTIRAAFNRLVNAFQEEIARAGEGGFGESIKLSLQGAETGIRAIIQGLQLEFSALGTTIGANFAAIAESVGDLFAGEIGKIPENFRQADAVINDTLRELGKKFGSIEVPRDALDSVEALAGRMQAASTDAEALQRTLDNLDLDLQVDFKTGISEEVGKDIGALNNLVDAFTNVGDRYKQTFENLKDGLIDRDKVEEQIGAFSDALFFLGTTLDNFGDDFVEKVPRRLVSEYEKAGQEIKVLLPSLIADATKEIIENSGKGADEIKDRYSKAGVVDPNLFSKSVDEALRLAEPRFAKGGQEAGRLFSEELKAETLAIIEESAQEAAEKFETTLGRTFRPELLGDRLAEATREFIRRSQLELGKSEEEIGAQVAKLFSVNEKQLLETYNTIKEDVFIAGRDSGEKYIAGVAEGIGKSFDEVNELFKVSSENAVKEFKNTERAVREAFNEGIQGLTTDSEINAYGELIEKAVQRGILSTEKFTAAVIALQAQQDKVNAGFFELEDAIENLSDPNAAVLQSVVEGLEKARGVSAELAETELKKVEDALDGLNEEQLENLLGQLDKLQTVTGQSGDDFERLRSIIKSALDNVEFDQLSDSLNAALGTFRPAAEDAINQIAEVIERGLVKPELAIQEFKRILSDLISEEELAAAEARLKTLFDSGKISGAAYEQLLLDIRARYVELREEGAATGASLASDFDTLGLKTQEALIVPLEEARAAYTRLAADSKVSAEEQKQAFLGFAATVLETLPNLTRENREIYINLVKAGAAANDLGPIFKGLTADSANLKAQTEQFEAALAKAKDQLAGIRTLSSGMGQELKAAFDGSLESVQAVNQQFEESRKKAEETREAAKGTAGAVQETANAAGEAANKAGELSENVKAGQGFASALASTLADAKNQMSGLSAEAAAAFDSLSTGAARVRGYFGQMNAEAFAFNNSLKTTEGQIQQLRAEADGARATISRLFASSSNGINQYLAAINSARNLTKAAFLEQQLAAQKFTDQLAELTEEGRGGRALKNLVFRAEQAAKGMNLLGNEDLQPLRQAIQNATSLMESFRAEVEALEKQVDAQTAQLEGRGQEFQLEQQYQEQLNQISALQQRADAETSTRLDRIKSQAKQNFETQLSNLKKEQQEAKRTQAANEDLAASRIPNIAPQGGATSAAAPQTQRGTAQAGGGTTAEALPGVVGLGAISFVTQKQQLEELGKIKVEQQQSDIRHLQGVKKLEDEIHTKRISNIEKEAQKASVTIGGLRERLFNSRELDLNDEFIRSVDKGLQRLSGIRGGSGFTAGSSN